MKSVHLKILACSTQRSLLNDQLVEELYGEIRNFFYHWKQHSYEIQVLGATRLCFFGTEHAKGRKRAT
jgi:hypothetical protein